MPEQPTSAAPAASGEAKQEFLIGGAILRLSQTPEDVWSRVKAAIKEGLKFADPFLLTWQRTAMHFMAHGKKLHEHEEAIKDLTERVAKMEAKKR